MSKIWHDKQGMAWEIKIENDQTLHRRHGEGEDKWCKGTPPGWTDKAKIPLDQRLADR